MRDTNARRAAVVIGLFGVRFVSLDARDEAAERFGEERLRSLVAAHGRESAPTLVEHLRTALAAYAPAGGDDVCLLAARNRARVGSGHDR